MVGCEICQEYPTIRPSYLSYQKNQSPIYPKARKAEILGNPLKCCTTIKEYMSGIPSIMPILERNGVIIEQGHDVEGAAGAEELVKSFELEAW